jgi:REP element-mobilizing transposase RayT
MPRFARLDSPGVLQHVIVRGNEKRRIFLDNQDRRRFLDRLSQLLDDTETLCFAWSLIPNHFHLLLLPTRFKLAVLMRRLLTGYAVTFNLIHHRTGHLFQNRYKSIVCDKDSYLLELVRYIHLNPIRAGLVETLEELDRYPWSGHSVLMGNRMFEGQEVGEVLGYLDQGLTRARQRYRRFVAEGIEVGHREDLVGAGRRGRRGKNGVEGNQPTDSRILGDKRFSDGILSNRPLREKARVLFPLSDLIQKVSLVLGIESEMVRRASKSRSLAEARGMICYVAIRELGYSGIELGRELNLGSAGVSRALKRAESVFRENPEIKRNILSEIGK